MGQICQKHDSIAGGTSAEIGVRIVSIIGVDIQPVIVPVGIDKTVARPLLALDYLGEGGNNVFY